MPETTPTPGPWAAQKGRDGDPNRWIVVQDGERKYIIAVIENGAPGDFLDTEEANAKLFAAAPDMLEVLECANDVFHASEAAFFPQKYRDKWGQLFKEVFDGRELYELTDLFELERVLRRRAISKAKGEADA